MKIWKGPEMEGKDKGILTLFFKTSSPDDDLDKILETIQKHPECRRLYFGAGKLDVTHYVISLFYHIRANDYTIIFETTPQNLKFVPIDNIHEVVLRNDLNIEDNIDYHKIKPKIEYGKNVIMYSGDIYTGLENLKNNIYIDKDIVLYNEED